MLKLFFIISITLSFFYLPIDRVLVWFLVLGFFVLKIRKKEIQALHTEELIYFLFVTNILLGRKSFAYFGLGPIYITDISIILLGFLITSKVIVKRKIVFVKELFPYILIFILLFANAFRTLLLDLSAGLDAARDSVIVFYSVWVFFTVYILRKKSNWKVLMYLFCAIAIYKLIDYLSIIGAFIFFKTLPSFEGFRFGAGYIIPSVFIFFSLCFVKKISGKHTIVLALLAMSILTLFHRSIYLGFLSGLLILAICLRGYKGGRVLKLSVLGSMGSLVLVVCVYLVIGIELDSINRYVQRKLTGRDGNVSYRIISWSFGLKKLEDSPILGYGVGKPLMYERRNKFYEHTKMSYLEIRDSGGNAQLHNSPLNFLIRYGFWGISLFILLHTILVFNLIKKWKFERELAAFALASIAYMFIYSCFNVVLEGPHDGSIYWIVFGIALSVSIYHYNWKKEFAV